MDANLVLILCIAFILSFDTNKVNGEVEAVAISNLTYKRSNGFKIVATNVTDSNNTSDATTLSDDGSKEEEEKTKKKKEGSEVDISKSEVNRGSVDESGNTKEDVVSNTLRKKDGFHGEECDPSNMCRDEEDQFVACLRVPGNDAPHLSLLIQNKGKSSLLVTITAPGFIRLEKDKVQLLENEDTKVKVSIKKGGSNDSAIILTSNKGHCRLELKDLAGAHESGNNDTAAVSRPYFLNIRPRTLIVFGMISFLVLSLVIIPTIVHICKNKSQGNNKYQRLDLELPVSNPGPVLKPDQETGDDGWNNNWGDDWDDGDEEQPNTPVLPVTPSVSARGLASRRLSKEGWKD